MSDGKQHLYKIQMKWTGNLGSGTTGYTAYKRDHEIAGIGKDPILGSSDPAFRGDPTRYNPEELLVASLSSCHMLWFLHLCANAKVVVVSYVDQAEGTMAETADGGGHFTEVVLNPVTQIKGAAEVKLLEELHLKAHHLCFIANSVNFPVRCNPSFEFV